eukprot:g1198.t1
MLMQQKFFEEDQIGEISKTQEEAEPQLSEEQLASRLPNLRAEAQQLRQQRDSLWAELEEIQAERPVGAGREM